MELPVINFDCKYFAGYKPCRPNKELGVFCGACEFYEKDESIKEEFPEIPAANTLSEGEKKIIIIKLDAVGDVLRTTSILPSLRGKYNDSNIIWITKERSFEVLKDNSLIDEIYFDSDELENIYNDEFDIAVNLDSSPESCAIMERINAKDRYGYSLANGKPYPVNTLANKWYLMGVDDNTKKANIKSYHRIIHEICGLEYSGSRPILEMSSDKIGRSEQLRKKFGLNNYDELILVNLGGGNRWQYKKWTKKGYIDLVNRLSEHSQRAVGIIAGDEDRDFYKEISDEITKRDNLIYFGCDNSLEDFICIIYLADKVFTSDSLGFHIATALGIYTVVIVGPTSHTELDVFGNGEILFSSKVDCLCCYLNRCPKTVTCMNTVDAEDIIKYLE